MNCRIANHCKLTAICCVVLLSAVALSYPVESDFSNEADKFAVQTRQIRQRQSLCIAYYTKVPYAIWKHACGMQSSVKRDDESIANSTDQAKIDDDVSLISRLLRPNHEKRGRQLTADQLNLILEQIRAQHMPKSPIYII